MVESELAAAGPFRAYDVEVVADQFARKINALCVWGRQLLAGVGDGSLLFFEEPPPRPAEEASGGGSGGGGGGSGAPAGPAPPWQVTRLEKGFCKKPILQLEVVLEGEPAGPALICLTGAVPGQQARMGACSPLADPAARARRRPGRGAARRGAGLPTSLIAGG
ncbi:hypothetical protein MNEG_14951 [Monoraphidium neglectum]|jgi:hypothetical protein|uniref:Uncharacterized protein n=1 Tax=Monoraphidium neglectum TaxID=145388 RepID=A0A0D2LTI1_9CHLO|nr:hypothetical protein MNEG_14951 [Monoraphidium neglectum]KIY93011.1 hypothetical protein MNEG_14951 [Monoraphidium neglectum]|eukprot:XP_013892031.1 hypothetical protein MNEG_14951 [Monoraphidium neglectum]